MPLVRVQAVRYYLHVTLRLKQFTRLLVIILILTATAVVFIYYIRHHPEISHQLRHTSVILLLLLLGLYGLFIISVGLILRASLFLCKLNLSIWESMRVTLYSSIINFFGPLQSGPAFRAIYLRRKYNLSIKKYTSATAVYYILYGAINAALLLSGLLGWWLLPAGLLIVGTTLMLLCNRTAKLVIRLRTLDLRGIVYLAVVTLLQVSIMTIIYFVELHVVSPHIHFSQAVIYTGAANLALFVAITPGAIGFRESFLVFSEHLHHVSNTTIIAANIIDRSTYVVLLLILAAILLTTHTMTGLRTVTDK